MSFPRYQLGLAGEQRAADYLTDQGWTVVERRYRGRKGEVDIIARSRDEWIFVEVKTSQSSPAWERVLARQTQRIRRGAEEYLQRHRLWDRVPTRFDVIWIWGDDKLEHLENAF